MLFTQNLKQSQLQLISEAIGHTLYNFIFKSVPIFIFGKFIYKVNLYINFPNLISTCIIFICAYIFLFSLEIVIGSISYYSQNIWGIQSFKNCIISFLSGKLLPIVLYPKVLTSILSLLPFSIVYYLPVNILVKNNNDSIILSACITLFSSVVLMVIYRFLSRKLLEKLIIQGG